MRNPGGGPCLTPEPRPPGTPETYFVRKLHQVPPLASVVPTPLIARTCQKYTLFDVRPLTEAEVDVAGFHDEHVPLVSETHHSYDAAAELAPHLSVSGCFWFG